MDLHTFNKDVFEECVSLRYVPPVLPRTGLVYPRNKASIREYAILPGESPQMADLRYDGK